jgi:hypothetical protein
VITDGTTYINGIGLGFTLLMCLLMLVIPRRYALVPIIILTCYMTMGQRVLIVGLNFTMIRILTLAGWVRVIFRGEMRSFRWNAIDSAVIAWTISSIVVYTLLWQTGEAFINKLGLAYNAIGLYFLFRCLVRDMDDIKRGIVSLAILIAPVAGSMLAEKFTGRNIFAIFGGVLEFTRVRDGVLRCQGPFAHPILAGTFGATLLPLFVGLRWQGKRLLSSLAIASCLVIVITAASSGPLLACVAGIAGMVSWSWRKRLRAVRWGILLGVIFLQLAMKSPVWYLMARVDVFGGSTGWHRAWLIDTAVNHFSEWWLLGIKSTGVWDPMLADVTNQYIWEGVQGGLLTMLLFILIIALSFRGVGRAVREMDAVQSLPERLCIWSLGAALFAHVMNYLSVAYWDQNFVNWYLLLAMISTATGAYLLSRHSSPVPLGPHLAGAEGVLNDPWPVRPIAHGGRGAFRRGD